MEWTTGGVGDIRRHVAAIEEPARHVGEVGARSQPQDGNGAPGPG